MTPEYRAEKIVSENIRYRPASSTGPRGAGEADVDLVRTEKALEEAIAAAIRAAVADEREEIVRILLGIPNPMSVAIARILDRRASVDTSPPTP